MEPIRYLQLQDEALMKKNMAEPNA